MAIKNIIFDLGKVLLHYDFNLFFEKIGYKPGERHLDEAEALIIQFESGKIVKEQFLLQLKNIYECNHPLPEIEQYWTEIFSEKNDMIELARKISEKFNIFIFSNTDELHFPYIWHNFSSLHFFGNNLMLSYQLNSIKPQKECYINALNKFGLNANECIFIDDRPENIQTAESLGIKGIIQESYDKTKDILQEILNIEL